MKPSRTDRGCPEAVPQGAETIHQIHCSTEDCLDGLLSMLVRREVQLLCDHAIDLGKIFLVGVGSADLIQNAFADSLQQCARAAVMAPSMASRSHIAAFAISEDRISDEANV